MNNYLDFLIDLWKITKEDGGFKAYAPLISKHKVNKSISVILCEDLEWVSDNGTLYVWAGKKPTKKDAITAELMVKARVANNKKENAKAKVKQTKQHKNSNTNTLVKDIKNLGKAITAISSENNSNCINDDNIFSYTDDKLKNDVKTILEESAEETTIYKRIYILEQEVTKLNIQLQTERKISFDEIDRLLASNSALEEQVLNLNTINSELRNTLILKESILEIRETENIQLNSRLNICISKLEKTTKQLEETNTKLNNTFINKIKSWFHK